MTDSHNPTLDKVIEEIRYSLNNNPDSSTYVYGEEREVVKDSIKALIADEVAKAYNKGYNDNSRDCYCDSPGATEGVLAHRHLSTDGVSRNIRPDIATIRKDSND